MAISALAFIDTDSPIRPYNGALSMGWLALTAWGSLVLRNPFTTGIAKRDSCTIRRPRP